MEKNDNIINSYSDTGFLFPRLNIGIYGMGDHLLDVSGQLIVDRRLVNSKISIFDGGITAAINYYKNNLTPNLLIIEVQSNLSNLMNELFELSEVCDSDTRVIIAGQTNDIEFYKELLRHGISEYIVLPTTPSALISAIGSQFQDKNIAPYAPAIAFVGTSGGVGTSMIAQSVAMSIANNYKVDTIFIDLDRTSPMSSLSWSINPPKGIDTILQTAQGDIDDILVKSCLLRVMDNLNLLTTTRAETLHEWDSSFLDALLNIIKFSRILSDYTIIDIPYGSITVEKYAGLLSASKIFLVTDPTVKGIRNLGIFYENILKMRPNDLSPKVILNKVDQAGSIHLDERTIRDNIGITPDISVHYIPEVIDLAIARGVSVASVGGSEIFNQDIQTCVDLILGKAVEKQINRSLIGKVVSDIQKVIGF